MKRRIDNTGILSATLRTRSLQKKMEKNEFLNEDDEDSLRKLLFMVSGRVEMHKLLLLHPDLRDMLIRYAKEGIFQIYLPNNPKKGMMKLLRKIVSLEMNVDLSERVFVLKILKCIENDPRLLSHFRKDTPEEALQKIFANTPLEYRKKLLEIAKGLENDEE